MPAHSAYILFANHEQGTNFLPNGSNVHLPFCGCLAGYFVILLPKYALYHNGAFGTCTFSPSLIEVYSLPCASYVTAPLSRQLFKWIYKSQIASYDLNTC